MTGTRRLRSTIIATALVVIVGGAGAATWALNRFVIDHVEISDVQAYEAAASASAAATTTSPVAAASSVPASTGTTPAATTSDVPKGTSSVSTSASATTSTAATKVAKTAATVKATASPAASATGVSKPVITANSYKSDSVNLTITKVVTGSGNGKVTYFVADITVKDATSIRSAFANNEFGTNIVELPSSMASRMGAVFAINGDYYGFRDNGIVVRNGVVYRDKGTRNGLAFYRDGTVKVYDETKTSGKELVSAGVWNTLSFGPAILVDGEIPSGIENFEVDTNFGNHSIQGYQPRTAVGMVSANHYIFVAVDGRSPGYSAGVTMTQMAKIMLDLGCKVAYNIDGGGSTTMVFNGSVINRPSNNGERATSDILYIAG